MKYYKPALTSLQDNKQGFCHDGSAATYGGSVYVYGCTAGGDLGIAEPAFAACTNGPQNNKGTAGQKYYGCNAGNVVANACPAFGALPAMIDGSYP